MMKKNTIFFIAISVFIELAIAILLCILIPSPANATSSYEYIIDSENLFDDSSEMLTMAKKIRNKLDFNIHIFSVENIESAETIIKDYMQDASALLIFISKDQKMTWWSASGVKHVIRDVDFEGLFGTITFKSNQYTEPVNYVLSRIISTYIDHSTETLYDEPEEPAKPETAEKPWYKTIYDEIIGHPFRFFAAVLVGFACYFWYFRDKKKSEIDQQE